jgi:hypothetical protein
MDPMEREREVDQWLDAALGQYGKAEPRAGLQNRVLANLQAEQNRIASRRRHWRWTLGAATAFAAIVVALWVGGNGRERNPGSTAKTSPTLNQELRSSVPPETTQPVTHPHERYAAREAANRGPTNRPTHDLLRTSTPKLAQFPSPQPLSEQEQILASYVADYPEHAALIAQARTQQLQEDHAEEMSAPVNGNGEDSQQPVQRRSMHQL